MSRKISVALTSVATQVRPASLKSTPQSQSRITRFSRDRVFYTSVAVTMILMVLFGFARTFFLRGMFQTRPLSPLLRIHGLAFSTWMTLFLVQTVLIATRNVRVHRRLGYAGAGLAAVMLGLGFAVTIDFAHRNAAGGNELLSFLAVPVFDLLLFGSLVAAAIIYRKHPETHKRLMLIATINLIGAAIERWPLPGGVSYNARCVIQDSIILVGIIYDWITQRRFQPGYIWGGLALAISQPLRLVIGGTSVWIGLMSRLLR